MATITREQFEKWNAQAKNGFKLDLQYYLCFSEKTLIKDIPQANGDIIQFKLWYLPEYETKTNEYGCRWNVRTGRQIPMMRIEKLLKTSTEGSYQVVTIKDDRPMGEPEKTLKYSTLCKISGTVNIDEELKEVQ